MQIVIDIDINLYARLFNNGEDNYDDVADMARAIRKGKLLPKHHGRLIDKEKLIDSFSKCVGECGCCEHHKRSQYGCAILEDAPTIIEADKESEDKK